MRSARFLPHLALAVLATLPALSAQTEPAAPPAPGGQEAPVLDPLPSPMPGKPLPDKAEIQTTSSGLRYVVLKEGDPAQAGEHPMKKDRVHVAYAGFLENGTPFDESKNASFKVNEVIKGWTEGLQLMSPGSSFKFIIPWKLAYGEDGRSPKIPPKANLVFDVDLDSFEAGPRPLAVPPFVMPPDNELTATPSGLKYKVLRAAEGPKPVASDTVTVHYAGWLTDGTPFDSSYERGTPASFPLGRVIKGWTEGLQLMSPGSSYLFVIPSDLAYGPGGGGGGKIPPNATLVFQVELLKVGR